MIDLHRFFLNPFIGKAVSREALSTYTIEHLARMVAGNHDGQFNELIAATGALLTPLELAVTTELMKLGIQLATSQRKQKFRAALPDGLSRIEGACLAVFGRSGTKMKEIFPAGVDAFNTATEAELDNKLEALVEALTANEDDVGEEAVAGAVALRDRWAALYTASTTAKTARISQADVRRQAFVQLRAQLFQNLLKLAALFAGDREKATFYCPQHLLETASSRSNGGAAGARRRRAAAGSGETPPAEAAPGTI